MISKENSNNTKQELSHEDKSENKISKPISNSFDASIKASAIMEHNRQQRINSYKNIK